MNEPQHHDEALRKLLKEWRGDAPLPPPSAGGVWQRIELADRAGTPAAPSVWSVLAHWIGALLARPALAVAYLTVLLAIGVTAGWTQAREENSRVKSELAER